jgi:imidazolonepropionase-like amidohydrolase
MKRRSILGVAGALLALFSGMAAAQPLAITHATIIDATGRAPIADGVIVIDEGRIVAVGPADSVRIPGNATRIDKSGKYVIPGLMDANVHLVMNFDVDTLVRFNGRYDEIAIEGAQIALKSGVTTVFDTWGPAPDLIAARDRIDSGKEIGTRIFLAGNIIGFDGPISDDFHSNLKDILRMDLAEDINRRWTGGMDRSLQWMSAAEVGKKTQAYTATGVDFLKYASSGHQYMEFMAFSDHAQKAIVDAGHQAGKTVQAHVTSIESTRMAMDAGADILTHCDVSPKHPLPPELLAEMAAKKIHCSILANTKAALAASNYKELFENNVVNVRNMIAAGVPLMMSTDAGIEHPIPVKPLTPHDTVDPRIRLGEGHFFAYQALEEMGIDPMKILQMTTINVATGYKKDKDLGSIEVGKRADLVILDKDPLASASNYRAIDTVIKDGRIVDRNALPTKPLISSQKRPAAAAVAK